MSLQPWQQLCRRAVRRRPRWCPYSSSLASTPMDTALRDGPSTGAALLGTHWFCLPQSESEWSQGDMQLCEPVFRAQWLSNIVQIVDVPICTLVLMLVWPRRICTTCMIEHAGPAFPECFCLCIQLQLWGIWVECCTVASSYWADQVSNGIFER